MNKTALITILSAMIALTSSALTKTVIVPSVGEVKLNVDRPGAWQFEITAEPIANGVDAVRVRMRAAKPATPPVFTVNWSVSQRDVHHLWTSESTHYGIPWWQSMNSEISSWMPLYAFIDTTDENRYTFACSESCRKVEFYSPIIEKDMTFKGSFKFFTVPEAPLTEYETAIRFDTRRIGYWQTLSEASDWMCKAANITPLATPESAFDPLYSSWYTFHQQVSAKLVEEECEIAAKLGMKTLITDDGWQIDQPLGPRKGGGYMFCGDWFAGQNFPDMAAHVKRVHALGFKYMLWYSVPFVGERSANFARFKGKYLPKENSCAGGWALDPRFPEVREFLISTYEKALKEWDLDGFKLDFIGRFTLKGEDPAVKENYAGRDIKVIPLAVERLMTDVMARLKAIKPDILIEFRQSYIGPCIRKFGNMIRATDCPCSMVENRTRIARLRLTSGNTAVHADMLEWRKDETAESAARYILNSMFGVIQYSVRLKEFPDSHLKMIKHWVEFSQTHREALLRGEFRPHHPASEYPLLEGESASERVIGVYEKDLVVPCGAADRDVYVMNAVDADSVVLDLVAPVKLVIYNTFGKQVATSSLTAGLHRVKVPPSGYAHLRW